MKRKTIIIPLLLSMMMLPSCYTKKDSLFLGGAPLKVSTATEILTLTATSKIHLDLPAQQLVAGTDGVVYISFREGDTLVSSLRDGVVSPLLMADGSFSHAGAAHVRCGEDGLLIDFREDLQTLITVGEDGEIRGKINLADYFPWSLGETRSIHVLDCGILAEQRFSKHRHIRVADNSGRILKDWLVYDIGRHDGDPGVFDFTLYMNPAATKAALLMEHFDRINILDLSTGDGRSVTTQRNTRPDKIMVQKSRKYGRFELESYYRNGTVSDNFIYALYAPADNVFQATKENTKVYLHIFTWEGDLVANVRLSDGTFSIAIDEAKKQLYGLSYDNYITTYQFN